MDPESMHCWIKFSPSAFVHCCEIAEDNDGET